MEDRVGEVLAQRRALESGAAAGVALSVFLHTAGAAIAIYAALHQTPPQTVNTLTINLEPITMKSVAPPPPAVRRAAPVLHEVQPVVEQPKPAAKPQPKTVPLSPFGKSEKKGSEHPVAPPPAVRAAEGGGATSTSTASNNVAIGAAGVTSIEGDFPYTIYIQNMNRLIGNHWTRPEVRPGTSAGIHFVIDRDGAIRDATVETSSGNPLYDRAALRAILETSPLPPLPFAYNGTYLGVHLIFK